MIEHSDRSAAVPGAASSTPSAVLGPFYIDGIQTQPNGTSIIRVPEPNGTFVHLHGTVTDPSGAPSSGAQVDIWQDAPNGLYEYVPSVAQDQTQALTSLPPSSQSGIKNHCRGRFETDSNGRFSCITVKPEPYPIPFDSSAGKLLKLMDRHPNRPAHIHLRIVAAGCATLVTQLFDRKSKWLDDDAVFAVKVRCLTSCSPRCQGDTSLTIDRRMPSSSILCPPRPHFPPAANMTER